MRASRLLATLLLLEARGLVTATELSETLEVSLRTVYRDIEHLGAAGVPVYAERGRAGGYRLLEGWQSRLTGLTLDEAQSLFLAGLDRTADDLGLTDVTGRAHRKLTSTLATLGDVDRLSSRFHLDPSGWYNTDERPLYLTTVTEALWNDRRLHVRYASWRHDSDRVVEPLGVVLKAGRWYLVARSVGDSRDIRMYRCSEIRAAAAGDRFRRPAAFDLPVWWRERASLFEATIHHRSAKVRVSASGRERLRQLRFVELRIASEAPDSDWTIVDLAIESDEQAVLDIARLGAEIEVLQPRSLRLAMQRLTRDLAALYTDDALHG